MQTCGKLLKQTNPKTKFCFCTQGILGRSSSNLTSRKWGTFEHHKERKNLYCNDWMRSSPMYDTYRRTSKFFLQSGSWCLTSQSIVDLLKYRNSLLNGNYMIMDHATSLLKKLNTNPLTYIWPRRSSDTQVVLREPNEERERGREGNDTSLHPLIPRPSV